MRLSHITTSYHTDTPIVTTGGVLWAFFVLAMNATFWDNNTTGPLVAGASLAMDALLQYGLHRYYVRQAETVATDA